MHVRTALAQQFDAQSFVVLPAVFTPDECAAQIQLFDKHWVDNGRPSLAGFGMAVHPLLQKIPDMATYYAHPSVLAALAEILDDQPQLVHTGARVSNEESSAQIGWHEHYCWDKAALPGRARPERVLFGCYIRGSNPELGPLVVQPRRFDAPLPALPVSADQPWDGQLLVSAPPGSVVIFDTALYHTAQRGKQAGFRYLWGAHIQGLSNKRPHPEDNSSVHPRVAELKAANPALARFIDG